MIKLKDILFEGKQVGILYHYCKPEAFEKIIDDGLILKDINNRGTISFTRMGYGLTRFGECRFVLDGNLMSQKYKIVPDSLAMLPNRQGKFQKDGKFRYKSSTELQGEERIYGIEIIPIKNYTISIEIISLDTLYKNDIDRISEKLKVLGKTLKVSNTGNWKPYK